MSQELNLISLTQGCPIKYHGGPQKRLGHTHGPKCYVFTHSNGTFFKKRSKKRKILVFAGQIKSFRGSHLARGPYVMHACSKPSFKRCRCILEVSFASNLMMLSLQNYFQSVLIVIVWMVESQNDPERDS